MLRSASAFLVASTASLIFALPAAAEEIHVRPDGPIRTLADAQREARKTKQAVVVHAGTYYLPETLVFTREDSGAVYQAAEGEAVAISGGRKLELRWEPYKAGIQQAKTPPGLVIDQLFVNGQRQSMARYPNYDPNVRPYFGFAADAFGKARAERWADPAGGFIHAMHGAHWGGFHYRITAKNANGDVAYEGGWQNNRRSGLHSHHRFVENIFEELDAPGEWFHDCKTDTLYLIPPEGIDPNKAAVEVAGLRHLLEFRGSEEQPVRKISLRGFVLRQAARTFMDTKEPLLRSDWTIYRGGAVLFQGAEDCEIEDCRFEQLGGNAIFVSGYNRRLTFRGCDIHDTGATAVAFVGDPKAVRNPLFEYGQRQNHADIDKTPGPRTAEYPAECLVEDCLIRGFGQVEKQAAGVQLSMAQGITVSHCSIYEGPRAGINISEGAFGGHVIEFCDVFDTVLETGDHGAFNSWGRDRYWQLGGAPEKERPDLALLDAVKPNVLRNNRWRCDHGWDVDLDDGSSNYEIVDNLFLAGGLKLREGYHRKVSNNIAVNNTLHPHVWFADSGDVVTRNIWMRAYQPAAMNPKLEHWGEEVDYNLFTSSEADRIKFADHGCDAHSLVGDAKFIDPEKGDFQVREGSPALKLGFQNFPMNTFGVRKAALRSIARAPEIPRLHSAGSREEETAKSGSQAPRQSLPAAWQAAAVRGLEGEQYSAYGVSKESGGVVLSHISAGSPLVSAGLKADDLIQAVNGSAVHTVAELWQATNAAAGRPLVLETFRAQMPRCAELTDYVYTISEASNTSQFERAPIVADPLPIVRIATRPATLNEPIASLYDGKLATNYGPIFGNSVTQGIYKVDLGRTASLSQVNTWSFHQADRRGSQQFLLLGSNSPSDPGWNAADPKLFTPIAEVTAAADARFLATSVRRTGGRSLGTFRWLIWVAIPLNQTGENTAFQEFQVVPLNGN